MSTHLIRVTLAALTLAVAFLLGMVVGQRTVPAVAQAAGSPIVAAFPTLSETKSKGDGTTSTTTTVLKVLAIAADGSTREYSGDWAGSGFR
jgi:xanthosine utilization system XapX-like protein